MTTEWVEPAQLTIGVALQPIDRLRLSADVDLSLGLDSRRLGAPRRPVVNARAGLIAVAIENVLELGGGAFFDVPVDRSLGPSASETRVTYVGGTLGGTLKTVLRVGDDPRTDGLVLTTTIAVRYAAGLGTARQISLDDAGLASRSVDVVTHDIMPYTGSSILF